MKRKIFQRIASVALSATLVITGIPAVFAADDAVDSVSVSYDASGNKLSLDVDLATNGKKMISVMVIPAGIANKAPETLAAESDVVFKAAQTSADGVAELDIIVPAGYAGRYVACVTANGVEYNFALADVEASATAQMYADIISGNYTAVANGLANPQTDAADAANIAKFIESNKATVTDSTTAVNTYLSAEAIAYVMSGKLELAEALATYKNYFGDEYIEDYNTELTAQEKAVIGEWFAKNGNADSFENTYYNNKFLAMYQCVSTSANLEATIMQELEECNRTDLLSLYNGIASSMDKDKVINSLFVSRGTVSDYNSVFTAFETECKKYPQTSEVSGGNSGGNSGGGGGGVTTGTIGTIGNVPVPGVDYSDFSDVTGHWAKASIDAMYTRGIVNGFEDGTFRPELNVTRAEFAKMIVCLLGLDASGDADFADVADNSWYNGYVAAAAKAGIVKGADGKFNPGAYITRQDAAVMLARVLEKKSIAMDDTAIGFNDYDKIAEYAKNSVNGMANLGIISGYNGGSAPLDNTTRAQAAALLQRVADHIG